MAEYGNGKKHNKKNTVNGIFAASDTTKGKDVRTESSAANQKGGANYREGNVGGVKSESKRYENVPVEKAENIMDVPSKGATQKLKDPNDTAESRQRAADRDRNSAASEARAKAKFLAEKKRREGN